MNPISILPGSDTIHRRVLSNGITVLALEAPQTQSVAMRLSLNCGSFLEPAERYGLATFTASALLYGTEDHSHQEIAELLECSGMSLNAYARTHTTGLTGRCLSEDLPLLLALSLEVLDRPIFPSDAVELLKERRMTEIELWTNDTETMSQLRFDQLLFGENHPYGTLSYGTAESTAALQKTDLEAFQKRYFGPQGMILSIVGGINAESVLDLAEKTFGMWKTNQAALCSDAYFPKLPRFPKSEREHIEIPEKSQMNLVVGCFGPTRNSEYIFPASVGNCILGEFGMMGRIGQTVREKNGLAYFAGSALTPLIHGGVWSVNAGVNPQNVEKTLSLIHSELKHFVSEPVSPEELSDVQSYMSDTLPLLLESNGGKASALANIEQFGYDLDYYRTYAERIHAVTAEEVLETARYFIDPERLIIVTAGTTPIEGSHAPQRD